MAEQATILIPDISGYTQFLTRTALVHSSHIINELLDLIVASNTLDLILSEIECDAVLFYRKGPPIALDGVISQCLTMFDFHRQLKIIGAGHRVPMRCLSDRDRIGPEVHRALRHHQGDQGGALHQGDRRRHDHRPSSTEERNRRPRVHLDHAGLSAAPRRPGLAVHAHLAAGE